MEFDGFHIMLEAYTIQCMHKFKNLVQILFLFHFTILRLMPSIPAAWSSSQKSESKSF